MSDESERLKKELTDLFCNPDTSLDKLTEQGWMLDSSSGPNGIWSFKKKGVKDEIIVQQWIRDMVHMGFEMAMIVGGSIGAPTSEHVEAADRFKKEVSAFVRKFAGIEE